MKRLCSLTFLLAALSAPPAYGAAPAGSPPALEGATLLNATDPLEASRYLGTTYKKESEGFKITPPAGSTIIERSGVDLVSFVVQAKSWSGSLQLVRDTSATLEDFLTAHKKDLANNAAIHALQTLDEKPERKGNLPGVRLMFSMQVTAAPKGTGGNGVIPRPAAAAGTVVNLLRQELVVQVKDHQFMVLVLYSPLADREEAIRTFKLMIPELQIFDATTRDRRLTAITAGKEWLAKQTADAIRPKLNKDPAYFSVFVGGQDVGYFRFDEMSQEPQGGTLIDIERDHHKGVLMLVNFRSFPPNGSVIYGQNEAFWAYSKDAKGLDLPDYSSWHNISKTKALLPVAPAPGRPAQPVVRQVLPWLEETGILAQAGLARTTGKSYHINVVLNGDSSQPLEDQTIALNATPGRSVGVIAGKTPGIDQMIPVEAGTPLPKIMEYMWTRFVDLSKPAEMSFVVYDSFARKLALRNLIVTGQKEAVLIDGKTVTCYKCIDELDPGSTTIWVDNAGRIQMMRTSDQSAMIPTTEAFLQKKWGARLKDQ